MNTDQHIKELNMIVPNFPLILYAKGFIKFNREEHNLVEDMRDIVNMCGYIPNDKPYIQILMLFDGIICYYQEFNKENPDKAVHLSATKTSVYHFLVEAKNMELLYNCSTEESYVHLILSELMNLEIKPPMKVHRLNYDATQKYKLSSYRPGMTYKEMQDIFDKAFGDCFLTELKCML